MDYREELLNRSLLMMEEAGIGDIDRIRHILVTVIGDYDVSTKCTDLVVLDDDNIRIIKMFLATKKVEGGSDTTAQTRWYTLSRFSDDINKSFDEVTTFDILCWLAQEQKRVRLSSVESYRNTIASFFRWMLQNGIISKNPMENVKPIKHPKTVKNSFTSVEVDALKTACKKKVERAMVELLLTSGLRCEELCNLKWEDINWTTKDINVIEGKGNKNRTTMMDDVTKKYLLEYRDSLDYESEYVFAVRHNGELKQRSTDSVALKLKTIGKKAGVTQVNPHKFRHTFATTLYKRGLDVRMIQKLMGHSNINTTMIYIDSNIDMLRDAYKRCL